MTRDEIIDAMDWHRPTVETGPQSLLARIERVVAMAVAREREACAEVCEARFMGDLNREDMEARRCAEAIRARGER